MTAQPLNNFLSINHKPKGIPYGGDGAIREDGDANYGFKNIKGNHSLLLEIPELRRDQALMGLMEAINGPHTGLLSIGCVSGEVRDEKGYRHTGYVELSINSISAIADARNYFPVFFHFDRMLFESKFAHCVSFNWELQPATFFDTNANGFTCTVFINTHYSDTQEKAREAWQKSLNTLAYFLASVPCTHQDFLYRPAES